MSALLIDENVKSDIAKVIAYAEKNPYTMDMLLDRMNKAIPIPGDMEEYTVLIPFGFKVVFTIEQQNKGDIRHLTMSTATPGRLPNPTTVEEIIKLFGFENEMSDCILDIEDIGPNHHAIRVVEFIKNKK